LEVISAGSKKSGVLFGSFRQIVVAKN